MTLEKTSPCKVNLLLNVLGRRADGFHELETVMHPVRVFDQLRLTRGGNGIQLTCSEPALPTDSRNLVFRAAELFLNAAQANEGVRLHLEKRIPLAAGLGGGSGNAATTLMGLNELFGQPLAPEQLAALAVSLGSDVPFFLQSQPALAIGRGEQIKPVGAFAALRGAAFLLAHPGFGVATAWAYQQLARFPSALHGQRGRAARLIELLQNARLERAAPEFYNSLEAPVLHKYPLLVLFQDFLREHGATVTLMSGSGSTIFAVLARAAAAEDVAEEFRAKYGAGTWVAVAPVKLDGDPG
ncbi:4-diphosphocytidyl-2-C-methyl-D-erythritol kinase [Verrucomicrobia bacterium]|nr:4-diphosphocytidyl-2-C-methyl-D-erythritol kinase [Verrucomicrobiota bacterium]